jgi:hypothetical protein
MLAREKEMEIVLKLAQRAARQDTEGEIQPRITEFDAGGQRVVESAKATDAIDIDQLYYELRHSDMPWATVDADGGLLLWTDEDKLAETLGIEENRFTSQWRDGRWVLVTTWDDATQLEAWLEPNDNNPSRPLVKFAARPRESTVRVSELETLRR